MEYHTRQDIDAWRMEAAARPATHDEATQATRRQVLEQSLASAALDGITLDAQLVRDYEFLVTGQMDAEEHRAFLRAVLMAA